MMRPMEEPHPGSPTPWGNAQMVERLAEGMFFVSTASHGGIWLSTDRQKAMPAAIIPRNGRAWLEEDCEADLAVILFDDFPKRAGALAHAWRGISYWYPAWIQALAEAGISEQGSGLSPQAAGGQGGETSFG